MVLTKYTVQNCKPLVPPSPPVAATGVWADTRCKLSLPFVILELLRGRDWPLRHKILWNCFPSLRKELEALMGPDELLTGKNTRSSAGSVLPCHTFPTTWSSRSPRSPSNYVQISLESVGFRPCRKANRGGGYRGAGSIVKTKVINGRWMIVP